MSKFQKELENLINYHSIENQSDTPDWILATFLADQLEIFKKTVRLRDKWYGEEKTNHLEVKDD